MPIYKINVNMKPLSGLHHSATIHSPDLNFAVNTSNEIQKKEITTNEPKIEKCNDHKTSDASNGSNFASLKRGPASTRSHQETIVEKEIRKQLEKEREIKDLHSFAFVETTKEMNDDKKNNHQKDLSNGHAKVGEVSSVKVLKSLEHNSNSQDHLDSTKKIASAPQNSNDREQRQKIYKKSVVHPFEDVENELESKLCFIQPQSETVIEKEIRLAKQREGSLRRARGLMLQVHQAENKPKVTEPLQCVNNGSSVENNRKVSDSCDVNKEQHSARRHATNRLKQEILKERQREMDLMKLGKVKTLSEERAALDISIIEELVAKELEERKRLDLHKNGHSSEKVQVKIPAYHPVLTSKTDKCSSLNKKENPRSVPLENIKYNDTHLDAETRIEEEIKEIKRREEELRDQRAQMGLSPMATSPHTEHATFITSYRRR